MARTRRSHQQVNKRLLSQLESTYCYAYPNTISMHAKQENPKLINPLALSPEYSFRQNFTSSILFSPFSMKTNDVSLPVAEPLLKTAQRVSLKPVNNSRNKSQRVKSWRAGTSSSSQPASDKIPIII